MRVYVCPSPVQILSAPLSAVGIADWKTAVLTLGVISGMQADKILRSPRERYKNQVGRRFRLRWEGKKGRSG